MGQYGLTEEEVKDILLGDFESWMRGQTTAIDDEGNVNYYEPDLDRYRKGLPVID